MWSFTYSLWFLQFPVTFIYWWWWPCWWDRSKSIILVRVTVDPEPIQGLLGARWEYSRYSSVDWRASVALYLLFSCSFISFHAFIQTDLQFLKDTIEQLRIKGLAQGPNRGSLAVLGILMAFQSVAQSTNHRATIFQKALWKSHPKIPLQDYTVNKAKSDLSQSL